MNFFLAPEGLIDNKVYLLIFLEYRFFDILILLSSKHNLRTKNRMQVLFFSYLVEKIEFLTIFSQKSVICWIVQLSMDSQN